MLYIICTLFSGIFSACISIYFRIQELKNEVILVPKHLVSQIAFFTMFALIFSEFFSEVFIDLTFITIGWFLIFVIFSSASYYAVQVFYELYSGNTLFATEEEMKKYIEKIENDRF